MAGCAGLSVLQHLQWQASHHLSSWPLPAHTCAPLVPARCHPVRLPYLRHFKEDNPGPVQTCCFPSLPPLSFCGEADDEDDAGAVASAISSCLSMVGSGGQLTDLAIEVSPVCHSNWMLAMRPLRRLSLGCGGGHIHVSPAIAQLTALLSLELHGDVNLGDAVRLPTSLTRVVIRSDGTEEMAPQVVGVEPAPPCSGPACLACLKLTGGCCPGASAGLLDLPLPSTLRLCPACSAAGSAAAAAAPAARRVRLLSRQPGPAVGAERQPDPAGFGRHGGAHGWREPGSAVAAWAPEVLHWTQQRGGRRGCGPCPAAPDRADLPGEG